MDDTAEYNIARTVIERECLDAREQAIALSIGVTQIDLRRVHATTAESGASLIHA